MILKMAPPFSDVVRLLLGRLDYDDAMGERWLDRALSGIRERAEQAHREIREITGDPTARSTAYDLFLAETDSVSAEIRAAAVRVEARRSLTYQVDEYAFLLLFVLGAVALSVAGFSGRVAAAGSAWLVHARGTRQAATRIPFHYGTEPIAWALYYPVVFAGQTVEAANDLRSRGAEKLFDRVEELATRIEFDSDDRSLPGQERRIYDYKRELDYRLTIVGSGLQNHWSYAKALTSRALVAATLVQDETTRKSVLRGWPKPPAQALAERQAKRTYGWLLDTAQRFVSLPGMHLVAIKDRTCAEIAALPEVMALRGEADRVLREAEQIAAGNWPDPVDSWDLPQPRAVQWSVGAGVVLLIGSYLPPFAGIADVLRTAGIVLLPGTAGKLAEKLNGLRKGGGVPG